ncbi:MAG: hypothetical protein KatS3mg097_256 [Candidatus Parcubacteria bacterium]|nr:MAG: hypothetical protein KatS3mg097_256 [Candidatus Parcubacteria bacterium]
MFFDFLQIIIGGIIVALIILQQRGGESSALFGPATSFLIKRRGLEKNLFFLTWALIFLFVIFSLLQFYKIV